MYFKWIIMSTNDLFNWWGLDYLWSNLIMINEQRLMMRKFHSLINYFDSFILLNSSIWYVLWSTCNWTSRFRKVNILSHYLINGKHSQAKNLSLQFRPSRRILWLSLRSWYKRFNYCHWCHGIISTWS